MKFSQSSQSSRADVWLSRLWHPRPLSSPPSPPYTHCKLHLRFQPRRESKHCTSMYGSELEVVGGAALALGEGEWWRRVGLEEDGLWRVSGSREAGSWREGGLEEGEALRSPGSRCFSPPHYTDRKLHLHYRLHPRSRFGTNEFVAEREVDVCGDLAKGEVGWWRLVGLEEGG